LGFGINPNFARSVSAYAVDADGKLTEVASSPFSVAPRNYPLNIEISPDGRHLFVATIDTNSVSVFAIGADGALSQIPGSPFPIGGTNPFLESIANTPNQPPTASFTMQIRPAGFPTSFDGSGSSDPDGSMVGYD
jgi:DNA-binding beta-propeller fold protein YncE